MSVGRQYKWGALLTYANILITLVIGLAMRPLMVEYLGSDQYGFYVWLGSLVAYVALMDLGLGNAVIRYVAKYRGEGQEHRMPGFLGMVIKLYSAIGAVILLVGAAGYFLLPVILPENLSPELAAMAQPMFALLVFNMTISLVSKVYPAVLNGHEQFAVVRGISMGQLLLRPGILILMLTRGCTALDIVILDTALNLLVILTQVLVVHFGLKLRIRFEKVDRVLLKEVFGYSIFIFLNMVMELLYWQVDATIIGYISMPMVVITVTGGEFATYMRQFSDAISGLMLPKATVMVAQGASTGELTDLMIRVGRIQLMVVCLLVVGFGFAGMEFLTLWMGAALGTSGVVQAYAIGLMLMLALVLPLCQCTAICIVQAMNRHAFRSTVLAGVAVLNVGISIVLARLFGPVGAAAGTVLSLLIGNVGIINWYYHVKIGLDIPRFFREAFHKILPALLLICAVCCLTLLLPSGTLMTLLLRILIILAVYCGLMYAVGMNASERGLILSGLSRFTRRARA